MTNLEKGYSVFISGKISGSSYEVSVVRGIGLSIIYFEVDTKSRYFGSFPLDTLGKTQKYLDCDDSFIQSIA